jgi:hypothetical protein
MALLSPRRLLILAGAGAGAAAFFLRRRREAEPPAGGGAEEQAAAVQEEPVAVTDAEVPADEEPAQAGTPAAVEGEAQIDLTEEGVTAGPGTPDRPTTEEEPDEAPIVTPDASKDASVEEQTRAAAAEAASVGGDVRELEPHEPGIPEDPGWRPVVEGSGDDPEVAAEEDAEIGAERQTRETPADEGPAT